MANYFIEKSILREGVEIKIPASKSESNRVLILNALSGGKSRLFNVSPSNDTRLIQKALASRKKEIDVEDAGTCMRFLTAYFSITNQNKILKGTPRMHQRPVGILVDSLRKLGADITYLKNEGYPPIEIKGFKERPAKSLQVPGNISSQFISALMMIAPQLKNGLRIALKGKVISRPYIELTAKLMKKFGVRVSVGSRSIIIPSAKFQPAKIHVDGDWTGVSYWYSLFALSNASQMKLTGLSHKPLQGDSNITRLMVPFGVKTRKMSNGYKLTRGLQMKRFDFDFINNPDIAQTLIVLSSASRMKGNFKGLESLRIKETDRIKALQTELAKIGVDLYRKSENVYSLRWNSNRASSIIRIKTYNDHRMAMSFAPLCLFYSLEIENPEVVRKSYPDFWKDLDKITSTT